MIKIKRPFMISFIGMALSSLMLMTGNDILLFAAIPLLSALLLFFAFRKAAVSRVLLILIICSLFTSVVFTAYGTLREKENALAGYGKKISGTVTDISADSEGTITSAVLSRCTVDNTKIFSKITVYTDKKAVFSYGDRLQITADELFTSEGEGIFRYHTLSDNCHLAATVKADRITESPARKNFYNSILRFRGYSSEKLRASLSNDVFSVSEALFTGSRDNISPELSSAFRICGISHIFAVSGMHLSLWTGIFFIIMKRRARLSFIPNALALLFVIFYTAFTGFSPSVLRAGIMLTAVFTGRIIRRRSDTLNSLGIAGTALLSVNPYLAGNVSFLLSFIATGAIAFWDEYILPEKKNFHGFSAKIKNRLMRPYYNTVTSVAVLLTTLPAAAVFFGYASLLSPLASLIITPLAEAVMILSSFIVVLPSDNILHSAVCTVTESVCGSLISTVTGLSRADFMLIPVRPSVLLPIFVAVTALCVLFLVFYKEKKKAFICILAGVLLFTGSVTADIYTNRNETEIKIFGKENATLISVSDKNVGCAVIGSGGSFSLANEMIRELNGKGITKADMLFIPRDKDTENKNTEYFQKTLLPALTVKAYEYTAPVSVSLRDSCRIYSYTAKDFCAVSLFAGSTKIVICPLPSSDFTDAPKEFLSGDILVCRSNIPQALDTGAFSDVIIATNIKKPHLSSFTDTVDRSITIKVKGDSYAVY